MKTVSVSTIHALLIVSVGRYQFGFRVVPLTRPNVGSFSAQPHVHKFEYQESFTISNPVQQHPGNSLMALKSEMNGDASMSAGVVSVQEDLCNFARKSLHQLSESLRINPFPEMKVHSFAASAKNQTF